MGQLNKQSDDRGTTEPQAAEALLRAMTQDIENLRQNLLSQLSQDVERLQREKALLIEDIEKLKAQRQQQILQQQQYVSGHDYKENVEQLIASIDSTLRATFRTLQQDITSYQSSLSEQLSDMYSLQKQGEGIVEVLVNRLRQELQAEFRSTQDSSLSPPAAHPNLPLSRRRSPGYLEETNHYNTKSISYPSEQSVPGIASIPEAEMLTGVTQSQPQSPPKRKRQWRLGLGLGMVVFVLSFLLQAFQNVVISVIFNKSPIFGLFELGGFVAPGVGNSLLILWLRMLVVVPLMAILSMVRYPSVWREIRQFVQSKDWLLFFNVLASGFFLFLSQVLIYLALGPIAPGVAITIFFIYPIFTVLFAWVLYGSRPRLIGNIVIFSVLVGLVLITLPGSRTTELSGLGVAAAAGAGISFAFHLILSRIPARRMNPVPLVWINYVILLTFAGFCLAGPFPESWWRFDVSPNMWPSLIISCLVLGVITILSNLLSNIGLRRIDPARALIFEATVPALTGFLALVIIESTLQGSQIFGMLIVTLGIVVLNVEQRHRLAKAAQATSRSQKQT